MLFLCVCVLQSREREREIAYAFYRHERFLYIPIGRDLIIAQLRAALSPQLFLRVYVCVKKLLNLNCGVSRERKCWMNEVIFLFLGGEVFLDWVIDGTMNIYIQRCRLIRVYLVGVIRSWFLNADEWAAIANFFRLFAGGVILLFIIY